MKMIRKLKNHYIAKCNYIKYVKKLPIDDHRIVLESQQGKEFGGNIYYIVAASKLKEADANEKTAYILDTISLIPDNLRNVADGILRYVTPEKLVPFIAVLAVRSLCGIGYGVLQIVGGNFACKDRNPLPNQPALNEYRL